MASLFFFCWVVGRDARHLAHETLILEQLEKSVWWETTGEQSLTDSSDTQAPKGKRRTKGSHLDRCTSSLTMKVRNSQRGCALKRSKKEEEILEHLSLEQLNAKADREWKSNGTLVFGAAQCKSGQRMDVKWLRITAAAVLVNILFKEVGLPLLNW